MKIFKVGIGRNLHPETTELSKKHQFESGITNLGCVAYYIKVQS